ELFEIRPRVRQPRDVLQNRPVRHIFNFSQTTWPDAESYILATFVTPSSSVLTAGGFMRRIALILLPAVLLAAPRRYARLGEFEGPVDVQLSAADSWAPAERNLPLPESAWIRTGASARAEIELDDGNVLRLGPDSQAELSDYTTLSTSQHVTLLSLDHGLAYFTGDAKAKDSVSLAVPGAQVIIIHATRLRLQAQETSSEISVLDGSMRFSALAAEITLVAGQTTRVEPANPSRFFLRREIESLDLDRWNDARDKVLAAPASSAHVLEHYGLADLDSSGEWIQTDDLGAVWKPKVPEGWVPFQKGRWRWYDALRYTWVSDDSWGWLPYHYGRWAQRERIGWVWSPSVSTVFKPGDVYWLRNSKIAGWGPLGPGEQWSPPDLPRQYLNVNTTYALFQLETRVVDPAGLTDRPKQALPAAVFTQALPSPLFVATQLDATRPILRAGSTRIVPTISGVTFSDALTETAEPAPPKPPAPAVVVITPPPADPPPPVEVDVPVPVPVLAGVMVLNSPAPLASKPVKSTTASTPKPPSAPANSYANERHSKPSPEPVARHAPQKKQPDPAELELYNQALADAATPAQQLQDLQSWSRRFPRSDFMDDRAYLFMQAYSRTAPPQPGKVVDLGGVLMNRNLLSIFPDQPQAILGVLYLMTLSIGGIPQPTAQQLASARLAADSLLQYAPLFFTPDRKPPGISAEDWQRARVAIESIAHHALALSSK
ncbi:MAG TPA: FecR family protein, partial [Bryobacteraceae bacterium]|nr:FecR family protein [Bryobacteraceae bacterium]